MVKQNPRDENIVVMDKPLLPRTAGALLWWHQRKINLSQYLPYKYDNIVYIFKFGSF